MRAHLLATVAVVFGLHSAAASTVERPFEAFINPFGFSPGFGTVSNQSLQFFFDVSAGPLSAFGVADLGDGDIVGTLSGRLRFHDGEVDAIALDTLSLSYSELSTDDTIFVQTARSSDVSGSATLEAPTLELVAPTGFFPAGPDFAIVDPLLKATGTLGAELSGVAIFDSLAFEEEFVGPSLTGEIVEDASGNRLIEFDLPLTQLPATDIDTGLPLISQITLGGSYSARIETGPLDIDVSQTAPQVVPLPATGWLLIGAVGALAALHRGGRREA